MPPGSYVVRRGRTFSFRIRLPAYLVSRVGRDDYVRALGTDNPTVARFLAAGLGIHLPELWVALRVGELGQDVQAALAAWFDREHVRLWRQFQSGDHARALVPPGATPDEARQIQREALEGDADARLERLQDDYRRGDYGAGRAGARAVVGSLAHPFDEGDQRFAVLMKRVTEALGELQEGRLRWAGGDVEHKPSLPSSTVQKPAVGHVDADVPTLGDVAASFLRNRQNEKGTSGKGIEQLRGQIDLVLTELGTSTKVTEVTPGIAGKVFNAVRGLPANAGKIEALHGLGLFKAADKARELGLKPMNPKTINNHMNTMRGLFRQAIDDGALQVNPFQGKHIAVDKVAGSERGFTLDEVERLLASPVFMGCERVGRPFQPGTYLLNDWRFWLPLAAMMTGARIAELCQLRREDVRDEQGAPTLHITGAGEKRIKTAQSQRELPVHDELTRLGFLAFVQSRPLRAEPGSLFDIPKPLRDDWGHKAGNWLREKLLPSVFGDEKREGLGFHSFRHNVETSMRAAGVRQDVSHRMMGHKAADVAAGYGRYEVEVAKDAVMKIRLPAALARIPVRT